MVIRADFIAERLQLGCTALRSAATPETWGHDMDVPEYKLNFVDLRSYGSFVGDDASLHAAKICSPGAVISGYIIEL